MTYLHMIFKQIGGLIFSSDEKTFPKKIFQLKKRNMGKILFREAMDT